LHDTPEALVPIVVGAGRVRPRAAPTALAVGHDTVVVPEAGVAVDAGADTAAVAVAVPATALLDDVELELVPPQAATASEQRRAAPAAMPRR
jgi:thiazole synthase ThiGH ThiG subunit